MAALDHSRKVFADEACVAAVAGQARMIAASAVLQNTHGRALGGAIAALGYLTAVQIAAFVACSASVAAVAAHLYSVFVTAEARLQIVVFVEEVTGYSLDLHHL